MVFLTDVQRRKLSDAVHYASIIPVVNAIADLRIPDMVPSDEEGIEVSVLSEKAMVCPDILYRILRMLSSNWGIFEEIAAHVDNVSPRVMMMATRFKHNEESKALKEGGEMDILIRTMFGPEQMKGYWSTKALLKDSSKPGFDYEFGCPLFEYLQKNPVRETEFADQMSSFSLPYIPFFTDDCKLPTEGVIADVGGGKGHALCAMLKSRPDLKGVVVDLPTVVNKTETLAVEGTPDGFLAPYSGQNVFSRLSFFGGSFFNAEDMANITPKPDYYFMKWILHDWSDANCKLILTNLSKAMKTNGKIFVCDAVVPDSPNQPRRILDMDVHMAVVVSGKERTLAQWEELAKESGLKISDVMSPSREGVSASLITMEHC